MRTADDDIVPGADAAVPRRGSVWTSRRRGNVRVMRDRGVSRYDAEVVIVGGGPVGMGLAIELGQRGVRCIVVERYPQPQPIPRART